MENNKDYQLDMVSVRLVKDTPLLSEYKINSPEAAIAVMSELMHDMDRELVCIINLKTDGTPINAHIASVGAVNETLTSPRELIKASILSNAAQMIIMHNHPSGRLTPSNADTMLTDRMLRVTELVGITLIDHIIVGGDNKNYFSFRKEGVMPFVAYQFEEDYQKLNWDKQPNAPVNKQDAKPRLKQAPRL